MKEKRGQVVIKCSQMVHQHSRPSGAYLCHFWGLSDAFNGMAVWRSTGLNVQGMQENCSEKELFCYFSFDDI